MASSDERPPLTELAETVATAASPTTRLAALVYRSRVTHWPDEADLKRLLLQAQARNRDEDLSGLLLYDNGRFFQWIEGPRDGLSRIWDAIRRDTRHTDVELLGSHAIPVRMFSGWDMKFACRPSLGLPGLHGLPGLLSPPPEAFDHLSHRPDDAPAVLAELADAPLPASLRHAAPVGPLPDRPPPGHAPPPLEPQDRGPAFQQRWGEPICDAVIPRLLRAHPVPHRMPADPPLAERPARPGARDVDALAAAAIGDAPDAAWHCIEGLLHSGLRAESVFLDLLEPTARRLGDLWLDDHCLDAEVTLGLARLQLAVRRMSPLFQRDAVHAHGAHRVLIATPAGEADLLSVTLATEFFWRAGWSVDCDFPDSDAALCDRVAGTWYDALDLTMHAAFRHQDRLDTLECTVHAVRAASCNPALVIVVGGRLFAENPVFGALAGADAACPSAAEAVRSAHVGVMQRHGRPAPAGPMTAH